MLPDAQRLYEVIDATWPAAAKQSLGPWLIRFDTSGSSRVSAATAQGPFTAADIKAAEQAMRAAGQPPLFMIREAEDTLDRMLADQGYVIKDPVNLYAGQVGAIATRRPPPESILTVWPPLQVQCEIWAQGGIGAGRLAVMERACAPKTTLLGRINDRPAGTVFVAVFERCAMIHALEIGVAQRRQGLGEHLTRAAAFWAQDHGAAYLALVTTQANIGANALYASLGMVHVGQYHYRILPE